MLFTNETLKSYAASKGITAVDETAFDILSQELEYRVKELCQEAAKFMHASHRTKLTVDDVNYALMARNIDPLFGYDPNDGLRFKQINNFYCVSDEEIDIEDFLNKPLPRISPRPSVHKHWLAVEGVQPQISQNPLPAEIRKNPHDTLQIFMDDAEVKSSVKHVLSKELQALFDKIMEFTTVDLQDAANALHLLENETGIQQLIPYFIQAFRTNLVSQKPEFKKDVIIAMIFALIKNKYIFIEPYLHQVIPALLSGLIAKHSEWETRRMCIIALRYVYDRFASNYTSLAPRLINTLKKNWLDFKRIDAVQLACVKCLSMLGDVVVRDTILPNAQEYCKNPKSSPQVVDFLKKILKDKVEL